ncbi:pimeloyl-ACP methyl ester carboxylesterase [Herbihabitans rhizosphaerae]|uniref:Pimeloyl-ACP methyl ester carboxylesterase n=1 Tax=Herbihabitans rhizosphaerae TaxID=1872711 RepID=A0A4Q7KG13_9PSEU|nr:alpha/beta hydrolase [Herbihabitans rhizosphaerae]RZS34009.1 pimeloyl-ACP methyl ester carboxylesterase [Herbihabitans rhizosphaerae]
MTTSHTLDIPGGTLHYEVRGSGPLLLVMGSPMAASYFAPLADALAGDHTVVTHDPRGISASKLDDPNGPSTPELRADDVAALLDALGAESADLFGTSGGAVTVLAFAERHPGRARTLVAHEPPLLELLPAAEAAEQRAAVDEMVEIFHRDGLGAAMAKFMGNAGFDDDAEGPPPSDNPEQDYADGCRMFTAEIRPTTRHLPDLDAIARGVGRVVVGVGVESGDLIVSRTSEILAEKLGTTVTDFPGDHGGFIPQPIEFADALRKALAG